MLVEFSVVPVGTGSSSRGDKLAQLLDIVDKSGLPYKANLNNNRKKEKDGQDHHQCYRDGVGGYSG